MLDAKKPQPETLFRNCMYPYIIELFSLYMFYFVCDTEAFNLIFSIYKNKY